MKVVVMGAGVIGVTTAYYLAKQGAEVVVIDRQTGPGLETSYANAGQLSYGMTSPWAAPGIPVKAIKWLFMKRRPLFIWPLISPTMWKWCVQMLQNCTEENYAINKGRMVRVSSYSRDVMPELIAETGIKYDGREQGTLQLFRTAKQMKASKADQDILAEYDSPYEVLGRDACIDVLDNANLHIDSRSQNRLQRLLNHKQQSWEQMQAQAQWQTLHQQVDDIQRIGS